MCCDQRKNQYIDRNTFLQRMAQEDMELVKRIMARFSSSDQRETDHDKMIGLDDKAKQH